MSFTTQKTNFIFGLIWIGLAFFTYPGQAEEPGQNLKTYQQTDAHTSDYTYRNVNIEPLAPAESWMTKFTSSFSSEKASPASADPGKELKLQIKKLADQLLANSRDDIRDEESITVCTFVNLNHLYTTSGLGRYLGEQMINELQLAGLDVFDVRITPAIMISQGFGEYGMSRDMAELSFVHPGSAMVVGTYSFTDSEIFINARLLRNSNGKVLSAASTVFAMNEISTALLADEARPPRRGRPVAIRSFTEISSIGEQKRTAE